MVLLTENNKVRKQKRMDRQFFGEFQDGKYVDEVLRSYFPEYDYKGVFFDVGAYEPIRISNSHHFYLNGWTVYAFEANPTKVDLLRQHRDHVFHYAVSDQDSKEPLPFHNVYTHQEEGWTASYSSITISDVLKKVFGWKDEYTVEVVYVPQKTIRSIIQEEIPSLHSIDIMSLDVEGHELEVLKGCDLEHFPPKVIVLENIDNNLEFRQYLEKHDYKLDQHIRYNQYYVHKRFSGPTKS